MSTVALDVVGTARHRHARPAGKLNAVDADLAHDLVAAVDAVAAVPEVGVVLVRARAARSAPG